MKQSDFKHENLLVETSSPMRHQASKVTSHRKETKLKARHSSRRSRNGSNLPSPNPRIHQMEVRNTRTAFGSGSVSENLVDLVPGHEQSKHEVSRINTTVEQAIPQRSDLLQSPDAAGEAVARPISRSRMGRQPSPSSRKGGMILIKETGSYVGSDNPKMRKSRLSQSSPSRKIKSKSMTHLRVSGSPSRQAPLGESRHKGASQVPNDQIFQPKAWQLKLRELALNESVSAPSSCNSSPFRARGNQMHLRGRLSSCLTEVNRERVDEKRKLMNSVLDAETTRNALYACRALKPWVTSTRPRTATDHK